MTQTKIKIVKKMETIKKELNARAQAYETILPYLSENEKKLPKYVAISKFIDEQTNFLKKIYNTKSNELLNIIDNVTNKGMPLKLAIAAEIDIESINEQEDNEFYETILAAKLQRENEMQNEIKEAIENNENADEQLKEIQNFCNNDLHKTDEFIAEIQNYILTPIENNAMQKTELFALKTAINIIKKLKSEQSETKKSKSEPKVLIVIYKNKTYIVTKNGDFIATEEEINPYTPLYNYTNVFANYIQRILPEKWQKICADYNLAYTDEEKLTQEDIITELTENGKDENYYKKAQEELTKKSNKLLTPKKLSKIAEIAAQKEANQIFWEAVAKTFGIPEQIDIKTLPQHSLKDILEEILV